MTRRLAAESTDRPGERPGWGKLLGFVSARRALALDFVSTRRALALGLVSTRRTLALAAVLAILVPASANGQEAGGGRAASNRLATDEIGGEDGWIGIRFNATASSLGSAPFEMLVTEVYRGGPADLAGIRAGDRLAPADPVAPYLAWVRSVVNAGPGSSVRLRLRRAGQEQDVVVVTGRRPPSLPPAPVYRYEVVRSRIYAATDSMLVAVTLRGDSLLRAGSLLAGNAGLAWADTVFDARSWIDTLVARELDFLAELRAAWVDGAETAGLGGAGRPSGSATLFAAVMGGAQLRDMTRGLARHFGTSEGVLVIRVTPASPAANAGFRAGDVVVAAGGRPLATASALRAALRNASAPLRLDLIRNGERIALFHPAG